MKSWLAWDGRRWLIDGNGRARSMAKGVMFEFLRQASTKDEARLRKFACASLEERRISSGLSSLECELPVDPRELDTNPFMLNFLNGTVDIRTSELRPHSRGFHHQAGALQLSPGCAGAHPIPAVP
jgi:putative DNA primase/helicase